MGLIRLFRQNKLSIFLFIFIWFIIGTYKISENSSKISLKSSINYSPSNFYVILEYLSKLHINLTLIDPILLNYLFIKKFSFEQLEKRLITFGILNDSIALFYPLFSNQNFSIKISKNLQNTIIDHIFIEYNQQIIHIAILHRHKSYFLIRKNLAAFPFDLKFSYGDTERIIESFEMRFSNEKFSFAYPRNVSHFLWLYNQSEFLECNRILANEMESKYKLYQDLNQFNLTINGMRNIVHGLEKFEKRYWLAGGTLLGWYRHCGLIPYTQDVDFGLFAEEYDENIRNYFLGNPVIYLWGALGLVNDSLEFRLFTGHYTFDLFWAYRENDHRWCGYQLRRIKYKRTLPLLPKLCSCDLFGYIFTIPCSPVEYLNNEYGIGQWRNPLEKNYTWVNMKYDSIWDDISWMYAVRLYTSDGKLRTDQYAIDWIQNEFNYSLETIPSFLNILPDKPVTLPPIKTYEYQN